MFVVLCWSLEAAAFCCFLTTAHADYSFYFPDVPYLVGQPNECSSCGTGASAIGNDMCEPR